MDLQIEKNGDWPITPNNIEMSIKLQTASADLELFPDFVVKKVDLELQRPPHNAHTELEILNTLSHKNIMRLIDYSITTGYVTFKLPRYRCDLNHYMEEHWKSKYNPYLLNNSSKKSYSNTLPLDDSLLILKQITEALSYIHANGIIHRDIKPHNIMMNSCNDVVLGDFGISYNRKIDNTAKTCDCSTSIYKAPELLFSISDYQYEVDIWALAIMLSQLWNDKAESKSSTSKLIDIDLEECSDIKLVLTLFHKLGKPSTDDWPQIANNDSFHGMFGNLTSDNYIDRQPLEAKLQMVFEWMPLIKDNSKLALMWLSMVKFNRDHRISAKRILEIMATI